MKPFYLSILTIAALIALVTILLLPSGNAQSSNSQEFIPSRFVITAAEINVLSPQMNGSHATQNVLVKMDTVTGRSWILQLEVAGGNEPRVRTSAWRELGFRAK